MKKKLTSKVAKPSNKLSELFEKKLASSGLIVSDAQELKMIPLSPDELKSLHHSYKSVCGIKINYHDPFGKPLPDWPAAKPFYRIRYLESGSDFRSMTDEKEVRYVQEPNTIPVAYYPLNQTWHGIVDDPNTAIIITEGELKSAKACKEGFPTIGLGGVWNWKSPKNGVEWIESLNYVNWQRRNIYIVFDSDYQTNEGVCLAMKQLGEQLHNKGSFVHIITLPTIDGFKKVGLDDFLTFGGSDANEQFYNLLTAACPLGLTKPLWRLNERYAYVQNPGLIINVENKFKLSPNAFKDHLEATVTYQDRKVLPNGNVTFTPVSAAAAWIKWPLRNEVSQLTYKPGKPQLVQDKENRNSLFNIWPGWGVEPIKDDVSPFLELVNHIFTGVEPDAKHWFLCWCAYPLQHPGTKLFSSTVLHGIRHGTGKSLIGYTMGRIYGKNFTEISQMDLHNSFNEWAEGKQFVMGDDVTGSNKRQDADFLKKLITQRELRVNVKFMPSYVVPDCVNYFFTANHPDSFFLEDDDRRFFIVEVQVGPMREDFYAEYDLWLDTGGANAVFDYLLNYDTGDFNPAAPAFRTSAKDRMIANVQSDLAGWVRTLIAIPDYVLRVGEIQLTKDLFMSKELLELYDPYGRTGTTANGLGRELARAGIRQVANGALLRLPSGNQGRYYAIRNEAQWLSATAQECVQHLSGIVAKKKGGKK